MAKIIELIISDEIRGEGKDGDPVRRVTQLFLKTGELVAEHDPCGENSFFPMGYCQTMEGVIDKLTK